MVRARRFIFIGFVVSTSIRQGHIINIVSIEAFLFVVIVYLDRLRMGDFDFGFFQFIVPYVTLIVAFLEKFSFLGTSTHFVHISYLVSTFHFFLKYNAYLYDIV